MDEFGRRLAPVVARDARHAGTAAARVGTGIRHQYLMAQDSRPHFAPPRDRNGRRLRASAHGTGPRFASKLPSGPEGWLPGAAKVLLVFVLAAGAFLGTSSAYITFAADLPDAHEIAAQPLPEDSFIFASDGTTVLADVHQSGVQHYYEPLSSMGKWLPEATIAIEDANFYHEPGVDPQGIVRAAWIDWREHRTVQGASTITQQLVKLRLVGGAPTFDRKVKEAVLAVQVDRTYSKDQILEMYLNTVFYGNHSQGSLAAARIYFHANNTKDLDLAQASMLAGIPQSPLYNSPLNNWNQAKARQREVLDAMVHQQRITSAQADQAYAEDLKPASGKMFYPGQQILAAPGFTQWVIDQLVAKYGIKTVEGGGLRVTTTLNLKLQAIAEQTMLGNLNNQRWRGADQAAMTAIDPHTGAVLAMVGAADPNGPGHEYNFAAYVPRNPGSSFKIFNYTAAIASGKWTMVTPVSDSPRVAIKQPDGSTWQPDNYGRKFFGQVQLQQAMGNSLNIHAVKVELTTGIDKVVEMARAMGAPPLVRHDEKQADGSTKTYYTSDDPVSTFGPALTLGGYSETPLQMATGASVLGAQGVLHPAFGIVAVATSDGTQIFKADPAAQAKQALDPKVAYIMENIMSDDNNRATVFGRGTDLTLPGRTVGAKTGTTDDFRDAWTVGYTPDLAAAVWVGHDQWKPMTDQSDGVFVAAPGWHAFMQQALDAMGKGNVWFNEPPGLQHFSVGGKVDYFLPGTNPNQPTPAMPPGTTGGSAPAPKKS
ncbi:MAG TPA: transglycosylase domain-containing protein [Candidatus Dormibacteraeota bacterium]